MVLPRLSLWVAGLCLVALVSARQSSLSPSPLAAAGSPGSSALAADSASVPIDPIDLRVVYPGPDDVVRVRDSSFLIGSVASGDVRLTINGSKVRVWPNGAWLAWVEFPPDSVMQFRIDARLKQDSSVLIYPVRRDRRDLPSLVRSGRSWVDTASLSPRGQVWLPTGEYLTLSARAAEGATVWVRLPSRAVIQLFPRRQPVEVLPGTRGFDRDTTKLSTPDEIRYFGVVRGQTLGLNPGPVVGKAGGALAGRSGTAMACRPGVGCPVPERSSAGRPWAVIEAALDGDTARAIWPLQVALLDTLPQVIEVNDDTLGNGETDGLTQGRAVPEGAYHWFLPNGTRAVVSGRLNQDLRLRLSPQAEAWIRVNEARPLPRGMPAPRAVMSSVTVAPLPDRVVLRIPLSERVPFLVTETERNLAVKFYGAAADVDWMHHERESLVQRMTWVQASQDELMLTVDLSEPVWGYRTRWSRNDLLLEIRRPPKISSTSPLRGRVIAVDPGHPPLGATGPTGLREAEANLAVALRLRSMLQAEGARVVMTRTADTAVDLWPRIALAETSGAELFVSIHNDALPDGVNPFTNNGTGVFYNRLRSAPLAAAIQRSLVRRLNLPDRGISRGDLAVVRQTWMPAVLCEGMFVILPEQEARLRSARGQRSYARGVLEGIRSYLVERARSQASGPVGQAEAEASPRAQPNTSPAPPRSGLERGVAP